MKSPLVTQQIKSLHRKYEKEEYEMLEEPKIHTFGGGNPSGLLILFKYLKVKSYWDFFPVRFVKTYCKKNYFLLQ